MHQSSSSLSSHRLWPTLVASCASPDQKNLDHGLIGLPVDVSWFQAALSAIHRSVAVCHFCQRWQTLQVRCAVQVAEVKMMYFFQVTKDKLLVFVISTYTDGAPPEAAKWFCRWVDEASTDFRVPKTYLKGLHFCVIALGNSLYKDNYCMVSQVLPTSRMMSLYLAGTLQSGELQGVQRPTLSYFVLLFHACPTLSYFFEKCPTLSYFSGFFSRIS